METLLLVGLISAAGSFMQSAIGFGYALIVMALWPLLLPFRTAAALEVLAAFAMVVYIAWKYRGHINPKLLRWPLPTVLIFNTLGFFLMVNSAESLLRRIMGAFLILLAGYFVLFSDKIKLRPTPLTGLTAGVIGGFCGGMLGIGGPPMVAYFLGVTKDKLEYVATLQCFFALSGLQMVLIHTFSGSYGGEVPLYALAALVGVGVGTALGLALMRRLPMKHLRLIVYPFLAIVGLYLVISG